MTGEADRGQVQVQPGGVRDREPADGTEHQLAAASSHFASRRAMNMSLETAAPRRPIPRRGEPSDLSSDRSSRGRV
jgi:hypothetical protein